MKPFILLALALACAGCTFGEVILEHQLLETQRQQSRIVEGMATLAGAVEKVSEASRENSESITENAKSIDTLAQTVRIVIERKR